MKDIVELILKLAKDDINIYLENGKLKINAPKEILDDSIFQDIKFHKDQLIEYLSSFVDDIAFKIPKTRLSESYVLSSSQRRLWILSQFEEGNVAYNIPGVYV